MSPTAVRPEASFAGKPFTGTSGSRLSMDRCWADILAGFADEGDEKRRSVVRWDASHEIRVAAPVLRVSLLSATTPS